MGHPGVSITGFSTLHLCTDSSAIRSTSPCTCRRPLLLLTQRQLVQGRPGLKFGNGRQAIVQVLVLFSLPKVCVIMGVKKYSPNHFQISSSLPSQSQSRSQVVRRLYCWNIRFIGWMILLGQYLVRAEQIALHVASTYQGAQVCIYNLSKRELTKTLFDPVLRWQVVISFRMGSSFWLSSYKSGCAQVNVVGGGSGNPSPLVSIPGVYTGREPGILISMYHALANSVYWKFPILPYRHLRSPLKLYCLSCSWVIFYTSIYKILMSFLFLAGPKVWSGWIRRMSPTCCKHYLHFHEGNTDRSLYEAWKVHWGCSHQIVCGCLVRFILIVDSKCFAYESCRISQKPHQYNGRDSREDAYSIISRPFQNCNNNQGIAEMSRSNPGGPE